MHWFATYVAATWKLVILLCNLFIGFEQMEAGILESRNALSSLPDLKTLVTYWICNKTLKTISDFLFYFSPAF